MMKKITDYSRYQKWKTKPEIVPRKQDPLTGPDNIPLLFFENLHTDSKKVLLSIFNKL